MKKTLPILLLLIVLVLIFIFFSKNIIKNTRNADKDIDKNNKNIRTTNKDIDKNNKNISSNMNSKLNNKAKNIEKAIYKKINEGNYFDSNLKSYKLDSLELYGYYKSKSDVYYIRVTYNVTCLDRTYNCDNLSKDKDYSIAEKEPFFFFIKLDTNNYIDIEIIGGISANINSDWIQSYEKVLL